MADLSIADVRAELQRAIDRMDRDINSIVDAIEQLTQESRDVHRRSQLLVNALDLPDSELERLLRDFAGVVPARPPASGPPF
jgi:prefoldin subunit 5